MTNPAQTQKGGDDSLNIQAGRDLNYKCVLQVDQRDFRIIDEIFISVIKKLQSSDYKPDQKHVNVTEKIKINFSNEEDRKLVQEYFKYAYTRISLINKRIQEEDSELQKDLHGHAFYMYNLLKNKGLSNVQILEKLFEEFTIPNKKINPTYSGLTRAYILFFFDDCTIFEKTDLEK